jgi:hypothetical protein
MDREDRNHRNYKTTALPTLRLQDTAAGGLPGSSPDTRTNREVLMKLYDQTCQTWRELIGVRFKLLGLVPAASILALAALFSSEGAGKGLTPLQRLIVAVAGMIVTIGLLVYDLRNSELHDDLIARGRKIEEELGVDTGIFRGRLGTAGLVRHDIAVKLIYGASVAAWSTVMIQITGALLLGLRLE